MSADIETMAYAGTKPWHNLGVQVSNDLTPAEMQLAAGLNWTVEKTSLFVKWGQNMVRVPDQFGLQRSTDGKILTIVGNMYKPVQPGEAMEFFAEFVKAGDMSMDTAGALDGGRRIWALASLKDGFTLKGGDRVDGYLLLCCPYKVGESFQVKFTGVRVVCANTLAAALNGKSVATFRMGHMKAFDADMQELAKEKLGLARERLIEYQEKAELLASSPIPSESVLLKYIYTLTGGKVLDAIVEDSAAQQVLNAGDGASVLDAVIASHEADKAVRKVRDVRESDLNRVGKAILEAMMDSPGSDLPSARNTWWGAVNGVTYAVDHQLGRSEDTRLTSAWFGPRAALKQEAVNLAVDYAIGQAAA